MSGAGGGWDVGLEPLLDPVRMLVYERFVGEGAPPGARDVAAELGIDEPVARRVLEELAAHRVLVLQPGSREIWMAMPLSAVPTSVSVTVGERTWWANCAWDALGVAAMLASEAQVRARCPRTGEALELAVGRDGPRPRGGGVLEPGVVHFAVPAARWWDDIGHT